MKKLIIIILAFVSVGIFAQESPRVYNVNNDEASNFYADLGTTFFADNKLVSTSTKKELAFNQNNNTGKTFLDLPSDEITEGDMLIINKNLFEGNDFNMQKGMVSFTKDKKTVFFSVNRKIKYRKARIEKEVKTKRSVNLQLFKASVNENGEWVNLEMLPFNSNHFSTGQPTLNQDDTKLYFVSDGPESLGRTDIFMVDLHEDGTYGKPVNLGPKINSREREIFPFVDKENLLYFSSDVRNKRGDLDVFACKIFDNTISTPVRLIGSLNIEKDDFTYNIEDEKHVEYFSSNKHVGKEVDDLYTIIDPSLLNIDCEQEILGIVKNVDTQEMLPNVKIVLFDENDKKLSSFISNEMDASFSFKQSCNTTYKLKSYLDGYLTAELDIKTINDLNAESMEIVINMSKDHSKEIDLTVDASLEAMDAEDLQVEVSIVENSQITQSNNNSTLSSNYDFNSDSQVFTVQIGAFLGNVQTDKYIKLSSLFNYLYNDGFNRYYSGIFDSHLEAVNYMKLLKQNGHNDAFVVGLKGKNRF